LQEVSDHSAIKFKIMSPFLATTTTKSEVWNNTVRKTKKFFRWIIAILVIVLAVFVYLKYFYTYSEGYRSGLLQKFSRKGIVFKTYEGEMILSSVVTDKQIAIASEKFFFTMINKDITRQFDTLQGQNVIVHYIQKGGAVFWRGDSRYLVDSIQVRN
jgi:hypothetical protein